MNLNENDTGYDNIREYRALEARFHAELMDICRRYITNLGIVSIMGIIDIVKQEAIELERATRRNITPEKPEPQEETTTDMLQQQ